MRPLRLLLQGGVGTLIGLMIAVALARSFFPADGQPLSPPDGLLPWTLEFIRFEPREKAFYLLSLVLGSGGAFFASYRTFRGDIRYSAIAVLLVAAIPLGNAYAHFSLQGTLLPWIGFVGALLLAVFYFGLLAKYGIDEPAESSGRTASITAASWSRRCYFRSPRASHCPVVFSGRRGTHRHGNARRFFFDRSFTLFLRTRTTPRHRLLCTVRDRTRLAVLVSRRKNSRRHDHKLRHPHGRRALAFFRPPGLDTELALPIVACGRGRRAAYTCPAVSYRTEFFRSEFVRAAISLTHGLCGVAGAVGRRPARLDKTVVAGLRNFASGVHRD